MKLILLLVILFSLSGCASNVEKEATGVGATIGALVGGLSEKHKSNATMKRFAIIGGIVGGLAGSLAGNKLNENRVEKEKHKNALLKKLNMYKKIREATRKNNLYLNRYVEKTNSEIYKLNNSYHSKKKKLEFLKTEINFYRDKIKKQKKHLTELNKRLDKLIATKKQYRESIKLIEQSIKEEREIIKDALATLKNLKNTYNNLFSQYSLDRTDLMRRL